MAEKVAGWEVPGHLDGSEWQRVAVERNENVGTGFARCCLRIPSKSDMGWIRKLVGGHSHNH